MGDNYSVRVEARFESAHFLRSYRGEPEPLHGHSYKVEAELVRRAGSVDGESIAVDFVVAERELTRLANMLDYKCINEVAPFTERNPSAENIAAWFAEGLSESMMSEGAVVTEVVVWEGPLHSVRYTPG